MNVYFSQHEVVLASLLASVNKSERKLALNVVKKLRKKKQKRERKTGKQGVLN